MMRRTIAPPSANTITQLSAEPNIMLSFAGRRLGRLRRRAAARLHRAHLGAQAIDEVLGIERQRRSTLDGDVGVETGRLGDLDELDARIAAMRHRELVDDRDAEPGLHERTDRGAEARLDRDVVAQ